MPLHRPSTISRDWYNPLKGLAMSRIVAYEDAAERGQYADLEWLWRLMEQTDVTVQAAIARRLSFIDSIDWEIRANEGARNRLLQLEDLTEDEMTHIRRTFLELARQSPKLTEEAGGTGDPGPR